MEEAEIIASIIFGLFAWIFFSVLQMVVLKDNEWYFQVIHLAGQNSSAGIQT